ncbi:MAG: hypothetical protein IRZ31_15890, partial [Thermogemmatispora sp.]
LSVDLQPAMTAFLQTIVAAQKQGLTRAALKQQRDMQLATLKRQRVILEQLALQGNEAALPAALEVLLQEWAVEQACEVLLIHPGGPITPADQDLRQRFWHWLERQRAGLVAELSVLLSRGHEERAQAEVRRNAHWEPFIRQFIRDQAAQQQFWQRAAYDGLQQQRQVQQESQAIAARWSAVALQGIQQAQASVSQAQQGAQQMYAFAGQVQSQAVDLLRVTHQCQQVEVGEAVWRLNRKRWCTRLGCACGMVLAIPLLLLLCYLILTHLY